jgi:hypothetical protein
VADERATLRRQRCKANVQCLVHLRAVALEKATAAARKERIAGEHDAVLVSCTRDVVQHASRGVTRRVDRLDEQCGVAAAERERLVVIHPVVCKVAC